MASEEYDGFCKLIKKAIENDSVFVVEGKNDKAALEKFGVRRIIPLTSALYKVIEEVVEGGGPCILLTDLDKEGKKIYSKLKGPLCERGVYLDNSIRDYLFKNTQLRQIEGLTGYFKAESQGF